MLAGASSVTGWFASKHRGPDAADAVTSAVPGPERAGPFAWGPGLWQACSDFGAGASASRKGAILPGPVAVPPSFIVRSEVAAMDQLLPEGSSLLALLDAVPSLAFIVDADVTVLEANRAARQWLGDGAGVQSSLPPGEVLHCIFPRDSRGECGSTDVCPSCGLRRSIEAVIAGRPAPRRVAHMILGPTGRTEDRWFQVSASPLALEGRKLALVVLEDATQLVELRELLPFCPGCGASRESADPLGQARIFLRKHPDFLLADELCAECRRRPPEGVGPEDEAGESA